MGIYFSGVDTFDDGGEQFLLGPAFALTRVANRKAKDSGQGGALLRAQPEGLLCMVPFLWAGLSRRRPRGSHCRMPRCCSREVALWARWPTTASPR